MWDPFNLNAKRNNMKKTRAKEILESIQKLSKKINESSNGSENLVKKYFDDVDELMPDGEEDSLLSPELFDSKSISEFEAIVKKASGGKVLKINDSKNKDEGYFGAKFGEEFTIKGKNGNFITGFWKPGAIAWGVGEPSQAAILTYYGK